MKTRILPLFLLAGVPFMPPPAHAQPVIDVDSATVYPWAQIVTKHCFYLDIPKTISFPAGVPVTIVVKSTGSSPTRYSGWHGHDSGDRPSPILETGTFNNLKYTSTDGKGCAYSGLVTMPDISGLYVFDGVASLPISGGPPLTLTSRLNVYAKTSWWDGANMQSMPELQENTTTMQPFIIHPDPDHSNRTRSLLGPLYAAKFALIANLYVTGQLEDGSFPRIDGIDFIRGSLADGGIADNMYGESGEWQTRKMERHGEGMEMDASNPLKYITDPILAGGYWNYFTAAIDSAQCKMGQYTQDGIPVSTLGGAAQYWSTQNYVHITCGSRGGIY